MVIFFTESEAGAPGYLSKKGEMSARTLSESLELFVKNSLAINIDKNHASRLERINENILKDHKDVSLSLRECYLFFKEIFILSGVTPSLKNTSQILGEKLAIPISLSHELKDTVSQDSKKYCPISKVLKEVFQFIKKEAPLLKLILLCAPLHDLKSFLKDKVADPIKYKNLLRSLDEVTQEKSISTAFISGVELHKEKEETWILDL